MNKKYLITLEYYKVLEILKKYTQSSITDYSVDALEPSGKYSEVVNLLKETDDATALIKRKGMPSLTGITDISSITSRLKMNANLNNRELLSLRDNLYISDRLKKYLKESNPEFNGKQNIVKDKLSNLFILKTLELEIQRCIISDDEMADDASSGLHHIRRYILNKQDQVRNRLNEYIRSAKYKKFIQDPVITIRSGRYVIPVKQEYKSNIKGLLHDSSSSGATLYIEPMDIVNLNNDIKELKTDEKREIERILAVLSDDAREHIRGFNINYKLLIFADLTFAKASMGINEKYIIPKLNDNGHMRLVKARHPLIDQHAVVPIDFHIGQEFKTLVITGPNTGGKTVSLKTVGLISLMTQTGLPIPVSAGTETVVFKDVFADIGDEQSIEQSLSTFSSHMNNIIYILKVCDEKSLVLLDELGAGTDPSEGSALALSIIERLMSKNCTTIATTHYQQIKMYASVTENIENASCEFDVKSLRPTFKLLIGIPGKSNALYISRRLGLDHRVIENAKKFIDGDNLNYEDVILSLEKSRQRIEKEKIKAIKHTRDIETMSKKLENRLDKMDIERKKIISTAKKEANLIIEKSKQRADEFLKELKELKNSGEISGSAKIEAAFKTKYKQILESSPNELPIVIRKKEIDESLKEIKPGDDMIIVDLNQPVSVLEVPDKNNYVLVMAGIMKIKIHLSNLKYLKPKNYSKNNIISTYNVSKDTKLEIELDIRGWASDEIDMKISKFLDNAAMMSLNEVYIIHGKGTGVLRTAVHSCLKSNTHIESFRLGKYGEGESGVTVIKLK